MSHYDDNTFFLPGYPPAFGKEKLWELEADKSYLKYLYPKITREISEFVEEECDKMEYEGSLMFDAFPDKIALQLMAAGIAKEFTEKHPDTYPDESELLRDMIEVVLFHEIMYRRNRYRTHKRLYL